MPESFLERYAAALAEQDWEVVAPLIHDDCVAVFSSGTHVGKSEVESAFRAAFDLIRDETYTISGVRWLERSDEIAVCFFDFSWTGLVNGEAASGGGRGTSVLKRVGGEWQLFLEHLGPPAPAPDESPS